MKLYAVHNAHIQATTPAGLLDELTAGNSGKFNYYTSESEALDAYNNEIRGLSDNYYKSNGPAGPIYDAFGAFLEMCEIPGNLYDPDESIEDNYYKADRWDIVKIHCPRAD